MQQSNSINKNPALHMHKVEYSARTRNPMDRSLDLSRCKKSNLFLCPLADKMNFVSGTLKNTSSGQLLFRNV